uniref:Uncharacterized protein n=1 Tax=Panagrolaimus davidi TaxID=227884 RepID=A0A914PMT0_9BILA
MSSMKSVAFLQKPSSNCRFVNRLSPFCRRILLRRFKDDFENGKTFMSLISSLDSGGLWFSNADVVTFVETFDGGINVSNGCKKGGYGVFVISDSINCCG